VGAQSTVTADVDALAARAHLVAERNAGSGRRTLIGIAAPPGAGKSTLAQAVSVALGPASALVAMDGFHLAQAVLERHGTAERKGAPETFDAEGYLALLARLQGVPRERVYAPEFDRSLEQPIAGAVEVGPEIDIIVTEGNYLLVDRPPWDRVAGLLDEAWYLQIPEELRIDRLVARHVSYGRTPEAARLRATSGTDGTNAALVIRSRPRADVIVTEASLRPADRG
jgi:pantothenate kinase